MAGEFNIFRKDMVIKYKAAGAYGADGFWVEGTETDLNIISGLQPLTDREMQMVPENRRNLQTYKMYTETELKTVEPDDASNADIILVNGKRFEVIGVYPYQSGIINHYKVIISEAQQNQ